MSQPVTLSTDGWTCHVCGADRQDERIGVLRQQRGLGRGRVAVYVRYCNDRPACRDGAPAVALRWLSSLDLP